MELERSSETDYLSYIGCWGQDEPGAPVTLEEKEWENDTYVF